MIKVKCNPFGARGRGGGLGGSGVVKRNGLGWGAGTGFYWDPRFEDVAVYNTLQRKYWRAEGVIRHDLI